MMTSSSRLTVTGSGMCHAPDLRSIRSIEDGSGFGHMRRADGGTDYGYREEYRSDCRQRDLGKIVIEHRLSP
jgi:hypothetical protein